MKKFFIVNTAHYVLNLYLVVWGATNNIENTEKIYKYSFFIVPRLKSKISEKMSYLKQKQSKGNWREGIDLDFFFCFLFLLVLSVHVSEAAAVHL